MVEAAASLYCKPEIKFTSKVIRVEGKTVLEIDIPKSKERPHFAPTPDGKNKAYIRVADENLLAGRLLLKLWKREKQESGTLIKYSDKEKLILSYLSENKTITLSKFSRIAKIPIRKAEDILVDFILLGIIEMEFVSHKVFYRLTEERALN